MLVYLQTNKLLDCECLLCEFESNGEAAIGSPWFEPSGLEFLRVWREGEMWGYKYQL
jgi:hypothetical protein